MGPQPSQLAVVKEIPFSTSTAEENALRAGTVDLGYVDPSVLTSPSPGPLKTGANWGPVANRYNLVTGSSWGFSYAAYNFASGSPEAKFLNQLYIRQALQDGVNQAGIIAKLDKGYGLVNYSPLPYGISPTLGHQPKQLYPYNLSAASALLKNHGWTKSGGNLTCTKPGTAASECGKGINMGDVLTITYLYGGGTPSFTAEVNAIVSAWQSLGMKATATAEPFNQVIADCSAGKTTWSVCDWGAGWIYGPDYYPSGEWGFTPGAGFNIGAYNNPAMTAIIKTTTFGTAKLSQYASYFEQQLPVMFQPNGEGTGEIIKTLKSNIGFAPNPLQNFNPEYFHF
jgi:peptide/nickel transport system substrate-binding protein